MRIFEGGPDHGRSIRDPLTEHFRQEYAYDRADGTVEIWKWPHGEGDTKAMASREEILNLIVQARQHSTTVVEAAILESLAYLVEHQSEQAWRNHEYEQAEPAK